MAMQMAFFGDAWAADGLPALPKKPRPLPRPSADAGEQMSFKLVLPSEEEFRVMTDEEVDALREKLLETALSAVVDGRVSKAQRKEWIDWIKSDEVSPFSFTVCCIENDAVPNELREVFWFYVRRHHKQFADEIGLSA